MCCYIFFFFKQKTAYDMRISDWSSDVCSSDLASTCGINWRVTMTRGRFGREESGMAADRARRGAAVKSGRNEKAGDERSLLRGERLKCGDEFEDRKSVV